MIVLTYKSLVFILINLVEKILFNNFISFNESISNRSLSNLSVNNYNKNKTKTLVNKLTKKV